MQVRDELTLSERSLNTIYGAGDRKYYVMDSREDYSVGDIVLLSSSSRVVQDYKIISKDERYRFGWKYWNYILDRPTYWDTLKVFFVELVVTFSRH